MYIDFRTVCHPAHVYIPCTWYLSYAYPVLLVVHTHNKNGYGSLLRAVGFDFIS